MADDDLDPDPVGEVPEGLGGGLYAERLGHLSRDPAFQDAVLQFPDHAGAPQEVALDQVTAVEHSDDGSDRTKILLRGGVIVVASGAVIAGAIAAIRYRRRHRGG
jgi:hypothetical protein